MKLHDTIIVSMPYGEGCLACPDCGYKFLREGAAFDTDLSMHNCTRAAHRLQDENTELRDLLGMIYRRCTLEPCYRRLIEDALRDEDQPEQLPLFALGDSE